MHIHRAYDLNDATLMDEEVVNCARTLAAVTVQVADVAYNRQIHLVAGIKKTENARVVSIS